RFRIRAGSDAPTSCAVSKYLAFSAPGHMKPSIQSWPGKQKREPSCSFAFTPTSSRKFRVWRPSTCLSWCPGPILSRSNTGFADYAAYFRRVKLELLKSLGEGGAGESYPDPNEHCETCGWRATCEQRRRDDDHLC